MFFAILLANIFEQLPFRWATTLPASWRCWSVIDIKFPTMPPVLIYLSFLNSIFNYNFERGRESLADKGPHVGNVIRNKLFRNFSIKTKFLILIFNLQIY